MIARESVPFSAFFPPFGFVSNFVFRISNFPYSAPPTCAMPLFPFNYPDMTKRILIMAVVLLAGGLSAPAATHHHHHSTASPTPAGTDDSSDTAHLGPDGIPITHAASVIVLDARTGQVLYQKNADERRAAASTQKLLTGLIVAESGSLNQEVTVDISDTWAEPVKLNIQPGQTYRRADLLQIMLVHSVNDVARCLARDNSGSIEAFADRMNRKAALLGMTDSHFVNPNGLPIPDQYSTARDLSKVAFAAYHNPLIRSIVCQKEVLFQYSDGRVRKFDNTNHVLLKYPLCNGMKTGYTDAAGHCLISSASNGSRDIISVVLGDNGYVWKDSYALLQWAIAGGSSSRIGSAN
jgi:D-alanyl-D-alanine carboxypeptidase (penicillin-binding protein 5/6)